MTRLDQISPLCRGARAPVMIDVHMSGLCGRKNRTEARGSTTRDAGALAAGAVEAERVGLLRQAERVRTTGCGREALRQLGHACRQLPRQRRPVRRAAAGAARTLALLA